MGSRNPSAPGRSNRTRTTLTKGDFKFHLTGEKLRGDFALVRIKKGKGNEWLLLKKKDAFAKPGWDTEDQARSVASGRTQEEIAQGLAPPPDPPKQKPNRALAAGRLHTVLPCSSQIVPMLVVKSERESCLGDDHSTKSSGTAFVLCAISKTANCAWCRVTAT